MPAEVLFYHLERQPLDRVLPSLLERTLERGWRAVVEAGSEERIAALNAHLWTYRADSFLPHGSRQDGMAEDQPVYLTAEQDNPNRANVRFLVDGAEPKDWQGYDRIVVIFDGGDDAAVARARKHWKDAKAAGCTMTYWQQSAEGRWERKA